MDVDGRLWLAGRATTTSSRQTITAPWGGRPLADVHQAGPAELDRALTHATAAVPTMAALPRHRRQALLGAIAAGIKARREQFAQLIVAEAGKPRRLADGEVDRAVQTFEAAAAVLLARTEALLPLDGAPLGEGRLCLVRERPRGVVVAITPFNFPLNLVAHKLAPAFAAGCPVVLKPAEQAPLSALLLARVCREAGLPDDALSVVPCTRAVGNALVVDDRAAVVSFTGSAAAGSAIKRATAARQVVLELGGDASVIVAADVSDAELDRAAARVVTGAFAYAGQVCISVQHVLVHASRRAAFVERLTALTRAAAAGDPARDDVLLGPVIDDRAAARLAHVYEEAIAGGGRAIVPLVREGTLLSPSIVEGAPAGCALMGEEAFGPLVTVDAFDDVAEAFARVNASRYGLQCGVFSSDLQLVLAASEVLDVGAVIHDDVPTFRVDHMPYGGVKDSGSGREGLPWALDDYVEPRSLVLRRR